MNKHEVDLLAHQILHDFLRLVAAHLLVDLLAHDLANEAQVGQCKAGGKFYRQHAAQLINLLGRVHFLILDFQFHNPKHVLESLLVLSELAGLAVNEVFINAFGDDLKVLFTAPA